jgi:NAD(P)H dehydrogenase (quinone)
VAVIYYSARGNVHAMARAVAEGAAPEGAQVRLRHVAELDQEMMISAKQYWDKVATSFTSSHEMAGLLTAAPAATASA